MDVVATQDSILDKTIHSRLIADMANVCSTANVASKYLHVSMKQYCQPGEIKWVTNFRRYRAAGLPGLVLSGENPEERCMAITAALLRNFIDARIIPLHTLMSLQEKGEVPEPSVLVIPNLYGGQKGIPPWKVQAVYDLLLQRATKGLPSVVYVESMDRLAIEYGPLFAGHLKNYLNV